MIATSQAKPRAFRVETCICFGLAVLTCAVFWGVLDNDFINFDDNSYVSQNRFVQSGLSVENFVASFTETFNGHWHPLTMLSYMLDTSLYGPKPGGYHLTNLLLHAANAILLFLLLRDLTGAVWRSAVVAALFAVHPLHVEPVAWIASRKDVLSTLFLFASIIVYTGYARNPSRGRYATLLSIMFLGLLAKPMLVTLPILLLILDYWPLGRYEAAWGLGWSTCARRSWELFREKIPLFGLAGIFAVLTIGTQASSGTMTRFDSLPMSARIANAVESYGTYLVQMVWPFGLAPFYPHAGVDRPMGPVIVSGIVLALVTLAAVLLARRLPFLAAGWFWYLVILLPVSGILQAGVQAYADRYTYVSLIGVFIIVVWGADLAFRAMPARRRSYSIYATALVVVLCSFLSWRQVGRWKDDETLFLHTLNVTEGNYVAHMIVGNAYFEQERYDDAIDHYRAGLAIEPNDTSTYAAMGVALARQGELASATAYYEAALSLDSEHVPTRANYGALLLAEGETELAIEHFERALAIQADQVLALNGLGLAFAAQERYSEAIETLTRGVGFAPSDASLHADLALVLAHEGRADEAIEHFEVAVGVEPDDADAHNNLAIVLAGKGRYDEAVAHFRRALEIDPEHETANANLRRCLSERELALANERP